jgi:hypothetical protein
MNFHKVHSLLKILRIEVIILQYFILSVYKYNYKVIQEEGPLIWEVDGMGHCERKKFV